MSLTPPLPKVRVRRDFSTPSPPSGRLSNYEWSLKHMKLNFVKVLGQCFKTLACLLHGLDKGRWYSERTDSN